MTDLNEQIAGLLGWTGVGGGIGRDPDGDVEDTPMWDQDLNLMHELENRFSKDDMTEYIKALLRIVAPGPDPKNWGYGVHATAEQKAIAWLKVKAPKSTPPPTLFRESKNPPR